MKMIRKLLLILLGVVFITSLSNKTLANENLSDEILIKEFIEEQNDSTEYFYNTGQIKEIKEYKSLEEIFEDFKDLNPEIFGTFEEYKEFTLESMKAKHEIEATIPEQDSLTLYSSINKNKVYTGDIVVTNATSSFGLTGHAGFVIDNNTVLTANKKKNCPFVEKFENWIKKAKDDKAWIQIIRPKDKALKIDRHHAKTWALENYTVKVGGEYKGRTDIEYRITKNLPSVNPTYCSKIPFQAYKFGAKIGHDLPSKETIILPYKLKDYFKDNPSSQFEHSIKNYY